MQYDDIYTSLIRPLEDRIDYLESILPSTIIDRYRIDQIEIKLQKLIDERSLNVEHIFEKSEKEKGHANVEIKV